MSNECNVVEEGIIICECGGDVSLNSTVQGYVIGGKKPLYWEDILGASISCPRSSKDNPCTSVASISSAGTEMNVGANNNPYLLRTDGFVTDKGRAVKLITPGQNQSRISSIPSKENENVNPQEETEVAKSEKKEQVKKEKYQLYFIRKSQDLYRPLRATKAFRKTKEKFDKSDFDNLHSYSQAFLYLVKNNELIEYKVFNKGAIVNETLKDIYFQNTKTTAQTKYIPLFDEDEVSIYYSNLKLENLSDIKKLKEHKINPVNIEKDSGFTIKEIDSIDLIKISKELIKKQENKSEKRNKLVVYIEDIIGEIEDIYWEYNTNYKLAHNHNEKIIDEIKEKNSYAFTISNLVDYFYVSSLETEEYRKNFIILRDCYKSFVKELFLNPKLYSFILAQKDLENIVLKDKNKRAFSFYLMLENYRKNFFSYESVFYGENSMSNGFFYTEEFISFRNTKFFFHTNEKKKAMIQFTGSDDYTLVKEDATKVLAHIVFCLFFLDDFEEELQKLDTYKDIIKVRNDFLVAYRKIVPLPNIGYSKRNDVKNLVESQEFYNNTVFKQNIVTRDNKSFIQKILPSKKDEKNNKFLEDYKQLDNHLIFKSFDYDYKIRFKSKLIYVDEDIKYYKSENQSPKIILNSIKEKLESTELKKLLETYKTLKTDEFEYVVTSMNIALSLCSTKIKLDEEKAVNGVFINKNIKHLLDFVDDSIYRKTKLLDTQKELLLKEYQVASEFDEYIIKELLNELIFKDDSKKESKERAKKFLNKYKTLAKEAVLKKEKIEPLDIEQDIKSNKKQIYETLKFMVGVTEKIDGVLDELNSTREYADRGLSKSRALQIGIAFKTYSFFMAMANIKDYIYDNNKDIKSTIGFVNDIAGLNTAVIAILQNEKIDNLARNFANKVGKKVNLANSEILTGLKNTLGKISAYAVITITFLDAVKYEKNEDYDALAATIGMMSISIIALFVTGGVPLAVFVMITSVAYALVMLKLVDSAFESYLKKSLFFKGQIANGKNRRNQIKHISGYPAKYLLETTNKNEKLKAIENKGFKTVKDIFDFIGKNYRTNEKYFNIALENELSFLIVALYGYKLEKEKLETHQRIRSIKGYECSFYSYEGLKIPKALAEDKEFKLYFSAYGDEYLEIGEVLINKNNYYIFNFFPDNNSYFNLTSLSAKLKIDNHSSYVIVISSQVKLKYKIEFVDGDKITPNSYIHIASLEQISFEPNDEELIKGNN